MDKIGWVGGLSQVVMRLQWTEWVERCEYDGKVGYVSLSEESESTSSYSTIVICNLKTYP